MATRKSGLFNGIEGMILLLCIFVAIKAVFGLAEFAHVDTKTSLEMNMKFLTLGGLYVISKIGGDGSLFSLLYRMPAILAGIWYAWWPALDYWSTQQQMTSLIDEQSIIWWDTTIAKIAGLIVVFSLGVFIQKLRDN